MEKGIKVAPKDLSRERPYKRPFDLTILSIAHLLPPLLLVWLLPWTSISLAIWLQDRGPVFFHQKRVGKNGCVFTIRKVRTMVRDAEKHTGAVWASNSDPRITRVGRILRWTALDELPQLLNICKGEMSLVGPHAERPELQQQFVQQVPGFDRRLQVRPRLTGLAQLKGDYEMFPSEKLRYGLQYIQHMSPWLDLKLIAFSVRNTFFGQWDRRSGK
jgi:lipopolysaccharide/colanic/teichoic acid biosynthesis glycosyltransferase